MLACFSFVSIFISIVQKLDLKQLRNTSCVCRWSGGASVYSKWGSTRSVKGNSSYSPRRAEAQSDSEVNHSNFSRASPFLQVEDMTHWIIWRSLCCSEFVYWWLFEGHTFSYDELLYCHGILRNFYPVTFSRKRERKIHQLGSKGLYMMCSYSELFGVFYRLYGHMAQSSLRRALQNSGCSSLQSTTMWFNPTIACK